MDLVLLSSFNVFCLIIANFIFGIITALLIPLIDGINRFAIAIVRNRFTDFRDYIKIENKTRGAVIFIDLSLCLFASVAMLAISFICNSGNFRLVSIPAFLLGLVFAGKVLCGFFREIVDLILFGLKWSIDIIAFPIICFVTFFVRLGYNKISEFRNKRRIGMLAKYTDYCFAHIEEEARYGLLNDFYKELEK